MSQQETKNEAPSLETAGAGSDLKQEGPVGGLDDDTAWRTAKVVLISQEQDQFPLSRHIAMRAELVKTMIEGDREETRFPLPNVKTQYLKIVVDYLKAYDDKPQKEIEKPLKSADLVEVVGEEYAKFVDVGQEDLFEIILAANYMDIKPLLDLSCAKVASMIKGKTVEQIRKTFGIINDFTPEEEEAIRKENAWAEEVEP